MSKEDLEDVQCFAAAEKDIYVEPPKLHPDTPDDVKLLVWQEWQRKDSLKRRAHKASITKKLQVESPDFEVSTYKSGGIHRQKIGAVSIEGDEENFEQIISIPATQDRYFQARGSRAGDKKESRKRKLKRNKLLKSQRILNSRSKK